MNTQLYGKSLIYVLGCGLITSGILSAWLWICSVLSPILRTFGNFTNQWIYHQQFWMPSFTWSSAMLGFCLMAVAVSIQFHQLYLQLTPYTRHYKLVRIIYLGFGVVVALLSLLPIGILLSDAMVAHGELEALIVQLVELLTPGVPLIALMHGYAMVGVARLPAPSVDSEEFGF